MTTDPKALESWIAQQATAILAMYRFDSEDDLRRAREAFDILKVRVPQFATLAQQPCPEQEAVALRRAIFDLVECVEMEVDLSLRPMTRKRIEAAKALCERPAATPAPA
jgi:predicted secreted protein